MIQLEPKQLKGRPVTIGRLNGSPVYRVETKGGLHLVMTKSNDGKPKTLGAGSHPATAIHIAERDNPELKITELTKSESLDPAILSQQVQEYSWLTRKIQEIQK